MTTIHLHNPDVQYVVHRAAQQTEDQQCCLEYTQGYSSPWRILQCRTTFLGDRNPWITQEIRKGKG